MEDSTPSGKVMPRVNAGVVVSAWAKEQPLPCRVVSQVKITFLWGV